MVEKTHSVILETLGVEAYVNNTHDNIFTVRRLTDESEHGNIGIYCIYYYSSWYGHPHMYCVPLRGCHDFRYEMHDIFEELWHQFCELKGIRKNKRNEMTTKYNPNKANIGDFLEFMKKQVDSGEYKINLHHDSQTTETTGRENLRRIQCF